MLDDSHDVSLSENAIFLEFDRSLISMYSSYPLHT
jgi:hypothetical protein